MLRLSGLGHSFCLWKHRKMHGSSPQKYRTSFIFNSTQYEVTVFDVTYLPRGVISCGVVLFSLVFRIVDIACT